MPGYIEDRIPFHFKGYTEDNCAEFESLPTEIDDIGTLGTITASEVRYDTQRRCAYLTVFDNWDQTRRELHLEPYSWFNIDEGKVYHCHRFVMVRKTPVNLCDVCLNDLDELPSPPPLVASFGGLEPCAGSDIQHIDYLNANEFELVWASNRWYFEFDDAPNGVRVWISAVCMTDDQGAGRIRVRAGRLGFGGIFDAIFTGALPQTVANRIGPVFPPCVGLGSGKYGSGTVALHEDHSCCGESDDNPPTAASCNVWGFLVPPEAHGQYPTGWGNVDIYIEQLAAAITALVNGPVTFDVSEAYWSNGAWVLPHVGGCHAYRFDTGDPATTWNYLLQEITLLTITGAGADCAWTLTKYGHEWGWTDNQTPLDCFSGTYAEWQALGISPRIIAGADAPSGGAGQVDFSWCRPTNSVWDCDPVTPGTGSVNVSF